MIAVTLIILLLAKNIKATWFECPRNDTNIGCINGRCAYRDGTLNAKQICICDSNFVGLRCEASELGHLNFNAMKIDGYEPNRNIYNKYISALSMIIIVIILNTLILGVNTILLHKFNHKFT